MLFGYGDGNGAHFDALLADILNELESSYVSDFEEDLQKTDAVGYTVAQRLKMYTPLYYLLESEDGYKTSTPAKHWRIRTGIAQSDTSLTTEVNLALALQNYDGVESVDFATIWGQQHVKAERTGDTPRISLHGSMSVRSSFPYIPAFWSNERKCVIGIPKANATCSDAI